MFYLMPYAFDMLQAQRYLNPGLPSDSIVDGFGYTVVENLKNKSKSAEFSSQHQHHTSKSKFTLANNRISSVQKCPVGSVVY